MIYADYTYYVNNYAGQTITEDAFAALARRASLFIDRITYGRLAGAADVPDAVRMAVCAVADVLQAADEAAPAEAAALTVKNESTDGRSVGYQDAGVIRAELTARQLQAAEPYLIFTGLMDRGAC